MQLEHERANRHWLAPAETRGVFVFEDADEACVALEVDADFLGRLADRGSKQIPVARLVPTARKSHVARPRIAHAFGAADEEDLGSVSAFTKDRRDGSGAATRWHIDGLASEGGREGAPQPAYREGVP